MTTMFFWLSQATFWMPQDCCTAVIIAVRSCGVVGSGRGTMMAANVWVGDEIAARLQA